MFILNTFHRLFTFKQYTNYVYRGATLKHGILITYCRRLGPEERGFFLDEIQLLSQCRLADFNCRSIGNISGLSFASHVNESMDLVPRFCSVRKKHEADKETEGELPFFILHMSKVFSFKGWHV